VLLQLLPLLVVTGLLVLSAVSGVADFLGVPALIIVCIYNKCLYKINLVIQKDRAICVYKSYQYFDCILLSRLSKQKYAGQPKLNSILSILKRLQLNTLTLAFTVELDCAYR